MRAQRGQTYPEAFAGHLQNVSNEMAQGDGEALSRSVHNESQRLLQGRERGSGPLALALPVEAAAAAPEAAAAAPGGG
eukprot:3148407-Pyramimonas_sp.AAC.1